MDETAFVAFMRSLIYAEAQRVGIPSPNIHVSSATHSPDAGIDGRVEGFGVRVQAGKDYVPSWFPPGPSVWQFKSGRNTRPSDLVTEIRKQGVQDALQQGAYYCVAIAQELSDRQKNERVSKLSQELARRGYDPTHLKLFDASQLAQWASDYPAILTAHFNRLIGNGLNYTKWREEPSHRHKFIQDEKRNIAIQTIRQFVETKEGVPYFHIIGKRGVGKTRLVLEALDAEGVREVLIYFPSPEDIPEGFWGWLVHYSTYCIVVVDECDYDTARKIRSHASRSCNQTRVITIGEGRPLLQFHGTGITVEELDTNHIEQAIKEFAPTLTHDQVRWIARLTRGYVRLAISTAELIAKRPDLSLTNLTQSYEVNNLIEALLPEPKERKVMQALSLVKYCGIEEEVAQQGKRLAQFFEVPWTDFLQTVQNLVERGLVQKKGRYRYITPDLLAGWLAAQVWKAAREECRKLAEDIAQSDQELARSFYLRLKDLADVPELDEVIRGVLSPAGFFRGIDDIDDKWNSEVFRILALGNRQAAVAALERIIANCTFDSLQKFREGRRNIVWTLEYTKWFGDTFHASARLLLALAEAENEQWANNATNIWTELFSIAGAGTAVPAKERMVLIQEALNTSSVKRRVLAVRALAAVLHPPVGRLSGDEEQGAVPVPADWRPRTVGEVQEVLLYALTLLDQALNDNERAVADEALVVLCNSARWVVQVGLADEVIMRFSSRTTRGNKERIKIRDSVDTVLEFESEKLTQKQRRELETVYCNIVGGNFADRLRRWTGEWSFADTNREWKEGIKKPADEAAELAEEAFANPDLLRANLEWLHSDEARSVGYFGKRLGEIDHEREWFPELLQYVEQGKSPILLASYLLGRHAAGDIEWCENLLDDWAQGEKRFSEMVFEITWRLPTSPRGAERMIMLVERGWLSSERLVHLHATDWCELTDGLAFQRLANSLLKNTTQASVQGALALIQRRLEFHPEEKESLTPIALRAVQQTSQVELQVMTEYYWYKLAEHFVDSHPLEIAGSILSLFSKENYFFADSYITDIFKRVLRKSPRNVWQITGDALIRNTSSSYRLLLWLQTWITDEVDPTILMQWAEQHGKEGASLLAELTLVSKAPLNEVAKQLLIHYGDDEGISGTLYGRFLSGMWVGSEVGYLLGKKEIAQRWLSDQEPAVRKWAKQVVEWLEEEIKRAKRSEEERGLQYGVF